MLKDIFAISGHPGLYKRVSQARNGIIVENIEDKKRMPAYASEKISALEDIAIFKENGEIPLKEVFKKIHEKEKGGISIDHKADPKKLKDYFGGVIPDYDKSKVYVSDIKKVINWYNLLHNLEMLDFTEKEEPETVAEETETVIAQEESEA